MTIDEFLKIAKKLMLYRFSKAALGHYYSDVIEVLRVSIEESALKISIILKKKWYKTKVVVIKFRVHKTGIQYFSCPWFKEPTLNYSFINDINDGFEWIDKWIRETFYMISLGDT